MAKLQSGTVVYGNLTVNTFANINGNLILGAQLYAGGSYGTNGQVLQNIGGTGVAWANPSSGSSIFNGTSNVTVLTSGSNVVISVGGSIIANIGASGLTIIGGLSAGTITGNGAALTGLPAGYSNVNAATYLPIYSGTVGASFVNSTGNVLAQAGVFNALGINGAITSTGFINTTANISTAQLNAGQINTTGNILSTGAVHNALTVTANNISTINFTDSYGAANSNKFVNINNGSNYLSLSAQFSAGSFNGLVGAGDKTIIYSDGSGYAGNLTIAPWLSNGTGGIRLNTLGNTTFITLSGTTTINGATQINSTLTATNIVAGTSPNNGSTGALRMYDASGNPNAVYLQAVNSFGNVQYAALQFNSNGNISASGNMVATIFYGKSTQAQYADLAETYSSDRQYVPGTVVVFGGSKEVTISTQSHDPAIAGVVSTNPAYHMNASAIGIPIALQGRVPTRVKGPVAKGDRLVASDIKGVAIKLDKTLYEPGCIIGKALEDIVDDRVHTIEVVVGRL